MPDPISRGSYGVYLEDTQTAVLRRHIYIHQRRC
jgi:hypothetical protein